MPIKTCEGCGVSFKCRHTRRKFCTAGCYHAASAARPNAGRWQDGATPHNRRQDGDVYVTLDQNAKPRAMIRVGEGKGWAGYGRAWVERSRFVWEQHNGPVPDGSVVHHKDDDTTNDEIGNLELQTRAGHIDEHRGDLLAGRKRAALRRMASNDC